ncbi:MAG: S41 family peptidase [Bacteroidia bacterium]
MKKFINIALSLSLISLLFGCEKLVLGPDENNDPVNNFEIFWGDFDKRYGLFEARDWDWDSVYQVYQPKVTDQTTDLELFSYFAEMIEYLDDSHTAFIAPELSRFHISGNTLDELSRKQFSLDLVTQQYVDAYQNIDGVPEELEFGFGDVRGKNIGYIYLSAMDESDPDRIDQAIAAHLDKDAIIVDIRNNDGGRDQFSDRIAGAFADGEKLVWTVETRDGPEHNDFDEPYPWYTKPADAPYLKPVILLTNRAAVSAAETFGLQMKSFAHVTQIGDSTAGDFSDVSPDRFLPNGWVYSMSMQQFLLPDGSSLDGIGLVPDIQITNTEADIAAGNDKVMERAFQFLFDEYGIE